MSHNPDQMDKHSISPTLLALCLVPSVLLGYRFWHHYPHDLFAPNHQLVVRDYLNIWAAGHLARSGLMDTIFDPKSYANWLWSIFGHRLDLHDWAYPPHVLLLAIPFSVLPLVQGFLVWGITTSALLWVVLRSAGLPWPFVLAVVLSPAGLENMLLGQNGALTTAALAGGLLLSGHRPVKAGALLALLTIKPQLGLLVPICLVAKRDWRTMLWACAFGVAYCGSGVLAFGLNVWKEYFTLTVPFTRSWLESPFGLASHYMMVPPFIVARAAGATVLVAYLVQALATAACVVLTYWAWAKRGIDQRLAVALTLCLAPLATPYSYSYDLVCVAAGCAVLVNAISERDGIPPSRWRLLLPAWVWPGSALAIGTVICPGLGAVSVGLAAWLAGLYVASASAAYCRAQRAPATA